jgi:hypothetical protein
MSNKSKSDFQRIIDAEEEVEQRRRRLENNIYRGVIVLCVMGFASAGLNSSTMTSLVSWFSPSGGHNATVIYYAAVSGNDLSHNSSQGFPTFNNSFIRFNVSVADADLNDWHTMFVCNTTDTNYTLTHNNVVYRYRCGGGHLQMCNYSGKIMTTDNPMYCDFDIRGWANQTQNFTLFVVDSGAKVVWVGGTWAGDRPPRIINIALSKL